MQTITTKSATAAESILAIDFGKYKSVAAQAEDTPNLAVFYAGGVTAISRWLSAATPPEKRCEKRLTPAGVAATPAGVVDNTDRRPWCPCAQPPANARPSNRAARGERARRQTPSL